mmetsp:Transcript_39834/g.78023  ORF Transcript_39834/g.78023 Transcript_39834/m.78023 type:complete len:94 (+) Transcript_39834:751-1032(+)
MTVGDKQVRGVDSQPFLFFLEASIGADQGGFEVMGGTGTVLLEEAETVAVVGASFRSGDGPRRHGVTVKADPFHSRPSSGLLFSAKLLAETHS